MRTALLFCLALGASSAAYAKEERAKAIAPQHIEYDDDKVEGDLVRAAGDEVSSLPAAHHHSLIRVRQNFIPEMIRSCDGL